MGFLRVGQAGRPGGSARRVSLEGGAAVALADLVDDDRRQLRGDITVLPRDFAQVLDEPIGLGQPWIGQRGCCLLGTREGPRHGHDGDGDEPQRDEGDGEDPHGHEAILHHPIGG
jgi:hypothetical protein